MIGPINYTKKFKMTNWIKQKIASMPADTWWGILAVIGLAMISLIVLVIEIGFIALIIFLFKWIVIDGLSLSQIFDKFF